MVSPSPPRSPSGFVVSHSPTGPGLITPLLASGRGGDAVLGCGRVVGGGGAVLGALVSAQTSRSLPGDLLSLPVTQSAPVPAAVGAVEKLQHLDGEQGMYLSFQPPLSALPPAAQDFQGLSPRGTLASSHAFVTLMFADIIGFTSMADKVEPSVVMAFLNSLYMRFDAVLEKHNVYKVGVW
jgi:hypothetical protein